MTKQFVTGLARRAGAIAMKYFGKIGVHHTKDNRTDMVTIADLEINEFLVSAIKNRFPDHGIVSEEADGIHTDREHVWYIDPIDGTVNFAKHVPAFVIMIGLAKNNIMEIAVVYDPVHNELFFAQKNKGACLNNKQIHCSTSALWPHSLGTLNANTKNIQNNSAFFSLTESLRKEPFWFDNHGSAGINSVYTAAGRRDWSILLNQKPWDLAAPALILKEAGCRTTDLNGKPWTTAYQNLIAANSKIHKKILRILNRRNPLT